SALAEEAAARGNVEVVVHTAGLSPVQASAKAILRVDLLGTALVLDAFSSVIAPGGAGVCIASLAGTLAPLDPDLERRLTLTPSAALLTIPEVTAVTDPAVASQFAKRANQLRVRAAARSWGRRQARVNTISPGTIATPMGNAELDGPNGAIIKEMIDTS